MIKQRELTGGVISIGTMIKKDPMFGSLTFWNDDQGVILFSSQLWGALFFFR